MSYATTYGCGAAEAVHVCHDCPDGRVREFARVRSSGFIRKSYLDTLLANPTDLTKWTDGVTAGNITVLPETSGSYDPGDPKQLKGYGNKLYSYGPRTQKLTIADPDYVDNFPYYDDIQNRQDLVPFFVTSSMVHIFDKEASIFAKDPVIDDLQEEVVWQISCEVVSSHLPSIHKIDTIVSVFSCPSF